MKLVGKVPVEPLDDERLTNIERNLVVRVSELSAQRSVVHAPRRLLAFSAVALAVVVAGVVGWKLRGDGAPVSVAKPEQLAMKAGALDLGDAQITGADFAVTRSAERVEVVMQPGTIELHVEHRPERLFVVKAGNVEIEDVGTRFSVAYDGTNVDVRVTEGEVKVKHAGKEQAITASNAWTLELGPITIAELAQRAEQATQVVASAEPTPPEVAPGSTGSASAAGNHRGGNAGPTTGATTGTAGAMTGTAGAATGNAGATTGSAGAKSYKSNARKALEQAPLEAPDAVDTTDPKAAIASYLERVKSMPEGEDRAQVLYSIAVMQFRLKEDARALYTISGVLRRNAGPAYKAARWLDVRIRCMKAFDDECRMAAQKYLASFEDGRHAGVAQEILKEISRGQ